MKNVVLFLALGAILAGAAPLAPAAAVEAADAPETTESGPDSYVGPAAAFLRPPGTAAGPGIPGAGFVTKNPVNRYDWRIVAPPYEWSCNMITGFGTLKVGTSVVTSRPCTGRFEAMDTQYVVSFGAAPYAANQQFEMGGIVALVPVG